MTTQLEAAQFEASTAGKLGSFLAQAFGAIGGRTGFDPAAIVEGLGLRVQRPDISVSLTRDVGSAEAGAETQGGLGLEGRDAERGAPGAERLDPARVDPESITPRGVDEIPLPRRDHFEFLLAGARERGYAGTPEQLAGHYLRRLEKAPALLADWREASDQGASPRKMLEAIASRGRHQHLF